MMDKIKFTIILPTYNRYSNGLMRQALDSALAQKMGDFDWEIIVVDDASTDTDREKVTSEYTKNKKVRFITQEKNSGTPQAIKRGILEATGNYIAILGDDDLLPAESLYVRAKYIEQNPDLDWFYAKTQLLNSEGKEIETISQSEVFSDHHYARMFLYNYIQGGTTTIKTSAFREIEWPEWLRCRDDNFVAFELTKPGRFKSGYLDEIVYCYRSHGKDDRQSSKNLADRARLDEIDRRIRYELNDPELAFMADEAKKAVDLEQELKDRDRRLTKIYNSWLWKLTLPLRYFKRKISK